MQINSREIRFCVYEVNTAVLLLWENSVTCGSVRYKVIHSHCNGGIERELGNSYKKKSQTPGVQESGA